MPVTQRPLLDPPIVRRALRDAVTKLDPRHMVRNPVMFVVLLGSLVTTIVLLGDLAGGRGHLGFTVQIALWPTCASRTTTLQPWVFLSSLT